MYVCCPQINSKYSLELEQEARQWIEAVLGRPLVQVHNPLGPMCVSNRNFIGVLSVILSDSFPQPIIFFIV